VAVLLFAWMMFSGKLDLAELQVFTTHAQLAVASLGYWLIGPVILASLRWRLLLISAGYVMSVARSINLQLIGFFFTTVMPGSLGGDFVKVYYLIKDNPDKQRSLAMWTILLDRIVGMCGLFAVGAVFIYLSFGRLWAIPALRPVILLVYGYILGFIAFLIVLKLMRSRGGARVAHSGRVRRVLEKIYEILTAFRVYRDHLPTLLLSVLISTVSHALSFVLFAMLAQGLSSGPVDLYALAAIFPIGMLVTTLPLSPGGLGVGHVAFEYLFTLAGLSNGANVYNAYFVSQTCLNLTGVIAYLVHRGAAAAGAERVPTMNELREHSARASQ
jgi:uncharacterized protein (TIRG00374 family)